MLSLIRNYCCHHFYDVVRKCRQKKSVHKFAPSAKNQQQSQQQQQSRDSRRRYSCTKNTHTCVNYCCHGMSVNKKPIKRARNTLCCCCSNKNRSQRRAATTANQPDRQSRARSQRQPAIAAGSASSCVVVFAATVLFSNTLPETHHHAALSWRRQRQRQQQQFQYEKFFNIRRRRDASSQMLLEWRSLALYVCVCAKEWERRCAFVKFHCQFVSYETEMALQQQRSTTAGVAKKHVKSSFFSCSPSLSLAHLLTLRRHVNTCVLLNFQLLPIQIGIARLCVSLFLSQYVQQLTQCRQRRCCCCCFYKWRGAGSDGDSLFLFLLALPIH